MDASDVAESIITQLTRDDGEREWPILIMYPGGPDVIQTTFYPLTSPSVCNICRP